MNGLRDQFLAGAGRSGDQHAGVGRGDAFESLNYPVHLRARPDHALKAELLIQPAVQFHVGPPQPRCFGRFLGHHPKLGQIERFLQIIERPLLHGRDGRGDGAVAGDQNYLGFGERLPRELQNLQTIQIVHLQVGNHHIERPAGDLSGPLVARRGHGALKPHPLQAFGHGMRMGRIVVDNQHMNIGSFDGGGIYFGGSHATDDTG